MRCHYCGEADAKYSWRNHEWCGSKSCMNNSIRRVREMVREKLQDFKYDL